MNEIIYNELGERELHRRFLEKDDNQAFFEFHQRYADTVLRRWELYQPVLFRCYDVEFSNFYDDLLREALSKWKPDVAGFRTFFVNQICRRRVIDFTRTLWKRYKLEAKPATVFNPPSDDDGNETILDTGQEPGETEDALGYSEEHVRLFWKAFEREKPDCQALLRLSLDQGPKKFEEKAQILSTMGFKKKPTGWRDTWKRNRDRIYAYIIAGLEKI